MKKLSIEEKIILQIALANFVQSRQDAKENSYIPREYLDRDIKTGFCKKSLDNFPLWV